MKRNILISTALFAAVFTASVFITGAFSGTGTITSDVSVAVSVTVDSIPSGALLFVNGIYKGTTPKTVFLEYNKAAVRIVKEDYYEVTQQIRAKETKQISVKLERIPEGSLTVSSVPSGAAVFIGETFLGKTPVTGHKLYAGTYRIQLIRANYLPKVEQVSVKKDETALVNVALESKVETFYKTALAAEPDNIHFHSELAHYYLITGRKKESIAQYSKGLFAAGNIAEKFNEKFGDVSRLLNEIRKLRHKEKEVVKGIMPALEEMVRTLEKNKSIPEKSLHGIARHLKMLGRTDLATRLVRKGRERKLGFFELRELEEKARNAQKKGERENAYRFHMDLADVYEEMEGDAMKLRAVSHLKEAANMQKNPRLRVTIGIRMAAHYRELKREKESIGVLEKVLTIIPDDMAGGKMFWSVCSQLVRSYKKTEQVPKAREIYEKIITKYDRKEIQEKARQELKKLN